ncbi:MAG: PD40 domain-containing protein [Anaerolineae bacterium]|nr:PD40 domain-containing protein [Anaerolineae bacterium]
MSQATIGGRNQALNRAAILATLTLILFLTSLIPPSPTGYAAAFPGQNGKFVVTIDTSGSWDLDTFELYVITENASGKNLKRLTYNSEFDFYPAWSTDGKKIAFSRRSQAGNYDIYVMDANGKNQKNLTNTPTIDEVVPAWSPDGQKFAVSSCPNGDFDFDAEEYNCLEIYVMDADGSNKMRLTDDNGQEDYGPTWSPDGQKIAFGTNRDGNREIYVMDADGNNETNLTNHPADDGFFAPYWSPNGEKIAFTTDRDGNWEIYVMNADGSNQTRLTNNDSSDSIPVWSADGQKIAFKTNRDGGNWEIYVMDTVGGNQTRLTNTELQVRILDWQSLGNKKN